MSIKARKTFAIISHPDAGKTTITEKLLLYGGAIQLAGTVKSRKANKFATSDWMALEKERGISVTTSVMQFDYLNCAVNLLDTPGHEDFSEDTYRTLTAVDSALMVVDAVKGVEPRTIKLMEICRMRDTPIFTFVNKLDRDARSPLELLDEIERVLNIKCAPYTWPIGSGKFFKGIYNILEDSVILYQPGKTEEKRAAIVIHGLDNAANIIEPDLLQELQDELELVRGAGHSFNHAEYLAAKQTPVFFGSALNNFGVKELLDAFVTFAPLPLPRAATSRMVMPDEAKFSGFVFKVQANMDPNHHDRIAFMRICSGKYTKGMRLYNVRADKIMPINTALNFLAQEREAVTDAYPGDIIGIHNHGTIQVGDTFTQGEQLRFTGIPHFAPELFRLVRPKDPLRAKALQKGLLQLAEEGATQIFRTLIGNNHILGAVGVLQFDVVAYRLHYEYNADCIFEDSNVVTVRWVTGEQKQLLDFIEKSKAYLAYDASDNLVYLAPNNANLSIVMDRNRELVFSSTKEIQL